jgi:carotenoid cleavage dioxygenase-like enzyme
MSRLGRTLSADAKRRIRKTLEMRFGAYVRPLDARLGSLRSCLERFPDKRCGLNLHWFRAERCFVFHVMNAWDQNGRIILDVMQYAAAPFFPRADGRETPPADTNAYLMRWTLDPAPGTGAFTRAPLDDMCGEFPRLDERRTSLPNCYGPFVGRSRDDAGLDTIVWDDFTARRRSAFAVPPGEAVSEAVFVPRSPTAPEG